METYRNKWIQKIVELQHADGSWGYFHSLSSSTNELPLTTEQALRRLRVLGLGSGDAPIDSALAYIERCAMGEIHIPDRVEVKPDWPLFLNIMFATWLWLFLPEHEVAVEVSGRWAKVIEGAFSDGSFSPRRYEDAYRAVLRPKGTKVDYFRSFVNFYPLALLPKALSKDTEGCMLDYVLQYPEGIYYLGYPHAARDLPAVFASLETSRYLAVLELLEEYSVASEKLAFAVDWLNTK